MSLTSITSRELNQDVSKAKRAAEHGPVVITHRGRAAHVLLTIEAYQRIANRQESIVELVAMPQAAEVQFEVPRIRSELFSPPNLS